MLNHYQNGWFFHKNSNCHVSRKEGNGFEHNINQMTAKSGDSKVFLFKITVKIDILKNFIMSQGRAPSEFLRTFFLQLPI